MRTEALASLAHGAGRKYDRGSMHGRVRVKKSDVARLERNPYGGIVVCGNRGLLAEEAPEAYKNIERVIADLVEFGLARVVATFRPLVTFKKAQSNAAAGGSKREKSWKEDRR
jgi:release factor H-coupled RctB family protein